jgi:hypothetical protein
MSMDARRLRCLAIATVTLFTVTVAAGGSVCAASYQTVNFSVTADRPDVAEQVGKAAEVYRKQLAVFWLGKPLPNWSRPCKLSVREGSIGAGGQTTFQFARGEVLNWRMQVQGTLERILDSVLPHEVNHTIFACHFRRPLPRWADEGAATLFEHRSEQLKQLSLLNEVIRNKHELISLRDLLSMKEYPKGQRAMLTLYAQGYALADFLVQQKGRHAYLKFISDGERGGWEQAISSNFDHEGIEHLEKNWRGWVLAGMPKLTLPREQMLAASESDADSKAQAAARPEMPYAGTVPTPRAKSRRTAPAVVRSQSPDPAVATETNMDTSGPALDRSAPTSGSNASRSMPQFGEAGRSTLQAPTPRRRPSADSGTARGSVDEFLEAPASGQNTSTDFSALEPTTLSSPEADSDGRGNPASSEPSFDFDTVILPRERNVRSGSTPTWAGFPGQKKSF